MAFTKPDGKPARTKIRPSITPVDVGDTKILRCLTLEFDETTPAFKWRHNAAGLMVSPSDVVGELMVSQVEPHSKCDVLKLPQGAAAAVLTVDVAIAAFEALDPSFVFKMARGCGVGLEGIGEVDFPKMQSCRFETWLALKLH